MIVARGGRKRKEGVRRSSNGKSRGESADKVRAVVLAQPHRASLPEALRLDQKAETPLGRLELRGFITGPEYTAGHRYAEIGRRYMAALGIPNSDMRPGPGSMSDFTPNEVRRRKKAYDDAFECMAGLKGVQREVARVAVHERDVTNLKLLRCGLQTLARHFGLTRGSKSVHGETVSSISASGAKELARAI